MIVYLGSFVAVLSVPVFFYALGPWAPSLTVELLAFLLIGAEGIAPRGSAPERHSRGIRTLPFIYVPMQIAVTIWALATATQSSAARFAALLVATGVTTGVFGMLAAHDLVHGKSKPGKMLDTAMLTAMCYRHFRIAHIYGHHRHACTPLDAASARPGEGFYAFLFRSVRGQVLEAWRHEQRRLSKRGKSFLFNRVYSDAAIVAGIFLVLFAIFGARGPMFFAGESAIAILLLELFNYIAHYGLTRARGEPFADHHSWNCSNVLANAVIFNMGRHSDHHRRPTTPFHELRYLSHAPELPAGYAGSMILALAPPLWRKAMDGKVARLNAAATF